MDNETNEEVVVNKYKKIARLNAEILGVIFLGVLIIFLFINDDIISRKLKIEYVTTVMPLVATLVGYSWVITLIDTKKGNNFNRKVKNFGDLFNMLFVDLMCLYLVIRWLFTGF